MASSLGRQYRVLLSIPTLPHRPESSRRMWSPVSSLLATCDFDSFGDGVSDHKSDSYFLEAAYIYGLDMLAIIDCAIVLRGSRR